MSSFILSSEVVHDSSAVVSGITFIGIDRGRDSGKETHDPDQHKHPCRAHTVLF